MRTSGIWESIKDDFNDESSKAWGSIVTKTDKGFYYIATIENDPGFDDNGNEVTAEANAAFIVKACNNFDDMLRKLKAYKGVCKDDKELETIIAKAEVSE